MNALSVVALGTALTTGVGLGLQSDEPTPYERQLSRAEVEVRADGMLERIDVEARSVDIDALVTMIAAESGRKPTGLASLARHPQITAKLENAILRDALQWIGGSVGIRITVKADTIHVEEDLPPHPTRAQLMKRAQTAYFRALRDHLDSSHAPKAAMRLARIEASTPGRTLEAAGAFDNVATNYPDSDLAATALLEAGKHFMAAGRYLDAVERFNALVAHEHPHEHMVAARRHLADAHTRVAESNENPVAAIANARRALLVLDALDGDKPSDDPQERRARATIRSRAHSLAGEPVDALKSLDLAEKYSADGFRDAELAELRALAFERAGFTSDAVRAWLRYSTFVEGEEYVRALRRAARTANRGGEHLAAIAIAKTAANDGYGDELALEADAAWTALDIEPERVDLFGSSERLTLGLGYATKGKLEEAVETLRPVFDRRALLEQAEIVSLARGYSKALAQLSRIDEATHVLRECAIAIRHESERKALYIFASRLLEDAGEIDRAIAAVEGRL